MAIKFHSDTKVLMPNLAALSLDAIWWLGPLSLSEHRGWDFIVLASDGRKWRPCNHLSSQWDIDIVVGSMMVASQTFQVLMKHLYELQKYICIVNRMVQVQRNTLSLST